MQVIETGVPLSFNELYSLTLPEISSVLSGFKARIKMEKVFFGNLTAAIYNVNKPKNTKKVLSWKDIYPEKDGRLHEMTTEEVSKKLHAMFGGVRR